MPQGVLLYDDPPFAMVQRSSLYSTLLLSPVPHLLVRLLLRPRSSRVHISESAVPMHSGFLKVNLGLAARLYNTEIARRNLWYFLCVVILKKFYKYLRAWGKNTFRGQSAFYKKRNSGREIHRHLVQIYGVRNIESHHAKWKDLRWHVYTFALPYSREGRVDGFFDVKRRRWIKRRQAKLIDIRPRLF